MSDFGIFRAENDSHAISRWFRQRETKFFTLSGKKLVWNLKQNTGAISGYFISTSCSTVMQIYQNLFAILDNRVVTLAVDTYNCTNTTGIMLIPRII
jgi:hypothetical protein